jgi:DNA invertase Pin-like site-specific DNA recombinase
VGIFELLTDMKPGNYTIESSRKLTDEEKAECRRLAEKGIKIALIKVTKNAKGIELKEIPKRKPFAENPES